MKTTSYAPEALRQPTTRNSEGRAPTKGLGVRCESKPAWKATRFSLKEFRTLTQNRKSFLLSYQKTKKKLLILPVLKSRACTLWPFFL